MSIRYVITNFSYNGKDFKGLMLFNEHKLLRIQAVNNEPSLVGGIYAGIVSKLSKDKSYCFVNITKDMAVYLALDKNFKPYYVKKQSKGNELHEGDVIAVQIEKSAIKTKLATATCNLSLAGRYACLTTKSGEFAVSSKIDKPLKTKLKDSLSHLSNSNYGIIIRTDAMRADLDDIEAEINSLAGRFNNLLNKIISAETYSVIEEPPSPEIKFLLEEGIENIDRIVTDIPEAHQILSSFCTSSGILDKLELYTDDYKLSNLYSISAAIEHATNRVIHLDNGGSIVIDQTESLTAIDVNMASGVKGRIKEDNIIQTNILAAKEIAYQLKLRNISGIIIVDFIDMKEDSSKNELIAQMKEFVKTDKTQVHVIDITPLGLMELTRKRVINSLKEQLK